MTALGFLKTVDASYVTEEELTTTLADYATIANADSILQGNLSNYYNKTIIDADFQTQFGMTFYSTTEEFLAMLADYEAIVDLDTDVAALGYLKTVDGAYVTESELATALNDYTTTEDMQLGLGQTLGAYQEIANLATDVAALGYAQSSAVYTKSASDDKYETKTGLNLDVEGLGFARTINHLTETQSDARYQTIADMSAYVTTTTFNSEMSGYYTSGMMDTILDENFYTKTASDTTFQTKAAMSDYVSISNLPAMFLALCQQDDEDYVSWSVISGCSYA